ncbi:MAG TPA: glycosyltransferase [Burkholderiales bacterium]|nr:glycosyltransferase [Burkholderiales bacterium]
MGKPLVSVVVATYNMAKFLPLAVRSALDQTYDNVEVLVIDDGSKDDTAEVIQSLLSDPRVSYRVQSNAGQAAAKNHGIREAKGEYVGFLDADDVWMPEKLALQMPLFDQNPKVGVVHSRLSYIDEHGRDLGVADNRLFRGWISGPLLVENFIGFGTTVVKRECFSSLGTFKEHIRMGIDYDLWLRFSTRYEFDYVDRPLLQYRTWSGQMSKNCKGRYQSGIDIMKNFLAEHPGVVDKDTERKAWAHTYVGFGQCMQRSENNSSAAMRFYAQALRYRPTFLPAWKAMVKTALRIPQ